MLSYGYVVCCDFCKEKVGGDGLVVVVFNGFEIGILFDEGGLYFGEVVFGVIGIVFVVNNDGLDVIGVLFVDMIYLVFVVWVG